MSIRHGERCKNCGWYKKSHGAFCARCGDGAPEEIEHTSEGTKIEEGLYLGITNRRGKPIVALEDGAYGLTEGKE